MMMFVMILLLTHAGCLLISSKRIDLATWSTNCGPGGATLFCGMHGFSRAIGWDVIQTPVTYVIGSNRYCKADYCKVYSFIRCG
jgi:hypothetical protein